jgi:hypothetical protein
VAAEERETTRTELLAAAEFARECCSVAGRTGTIALLRETDPDGAWSASEDLNTLRSHAADIASTGILDEILTIKTITNLLIHGKA